MAAKDHDALAPPLPGRGTKGQTKAGRLRLFDVVLDAAVVDRLTATDDRPLFVADVGIGATPVTLVEWARHLARHSPSIRLTGIERDAAYVAVAQSALAKDSSRPKASCEIDVVHGSFDHVALHRADVVRIANVLRVYSDTQRIEAEQFLATRCPEGTKVVEITCDPLGNIGTALTSQILSATFVPQTLTFVLDAAAVAEAGSAPIRFRDWLPRRFRRRAGPNTCVGQFLSTWMREWTTLEDKTTVEAVQKSAEALTAEDGVTVATGGAMQPAVFVGWQLPQAGAP